MADSLRPVGTKTIFGLLALGWRASRSSGVSRAKAGGERSRTPVSCLLVQKRPRMLYQSHFGGEYLFMEERGRTWMLLVLFLGDKRLETCGSATLDRLFP
jgi:hypothetical protein